MSLSYRWLNIRKHGIHRNILTWSRWDEMTRDRRKALTIYTPLFAVFARSLHHPHPTLTFYWGRGRYFDGRSRPYEPRSPRIELA